MNPPKYPIGEHFPGSGTKEGFIADLARLPSDVRAVVEPLSPDQLGIRYINWTVRQIVNHLADSHINAYARFRLALTENEPTIKPYDESAWARLPDADADPKPSLLILEGLHARWAALLHAMKPEDFARTFYHPESKARMTLAAALDTYAWHGKHHLGQVRWLAGQHGW